MMASSPYSGIPTKVRIGCYMFRIEVGEFDDHEAEGSFGHMNPISQKIRLRPGMSAQNLANTFIHEIMHGIHWFLGAGSGYDKDSDAYDIEEDYTLKGANGLCTFWQDNEKAVVWWARLLTLKEKP